MSRALAFVMVSAFVVGTLVAGCTQAAPAPTPTRAPAVPTKAAEPTKPAAASTKAPEPTKAPAAQPTAAPAKKVDYPEKGKAITLIVPYAPGGGADIGARVLAPLMEKQLGTSIQVLNRAGAASQLGLTETAKAKPDGYTIGFVGLPTAITTYLEPERKAVFTRTDFQPIGFQYLVPVVVVVQSASPYRTYQDVVDAAKARPGQLKAATSGLLGVNHLALLLAEKAAGVKFAAVHFDGGSPSVTALLGGHVDLTFASEPSAAKFVQSGELRAVAIMDEVESRFSPGVKIMAAQGYKASMHTGGLFAVPNGTPREIVEILAAAMKKAVLTDEHTKRMEDLGQTVRYMDPAQSMAYWVEIEEQVKPLMALAK